MLLISREAERYAKAVNKGPKVRLLKAMLQKWNSNIRFNLIVACRKFRAKMRFDEILKLRARVPGGFNFSSHSSQSLSDRSLRKVMTVMRMAGTKPAKLRTSGVLRSGSIKACVKTKGGSLSSTVFKIMKRNVVKVLHSTR